MTHVTVVEIRRRDVTGIGEREGLGDVERDSELSAVFKRLAKAFGVRFQYGFESRAARALRLLHRAVVAYVR